MRVVLSHFGVKMGVLKISGTRDFNCSKIHENFFIAAVTDSVIGS
jgi:hypothetical protein